MKLKTSVTLNEDIVTALREARRKGESRSQVIERLLRQGFAAQERTATDRRDRDVINAHADALNTEALDVLGFQVET